MERLQTRLRELSFLTGKADGIYGQQTTAAVREAQRYFHQRVLSFMQETVDRPDNYAYIRYDKK